MQVYNVCIKNTQDDSSFPIRADDEKEAAELWLDAWLRNEISWVDEEEIVEAGAVTIQSILIDHGAKGLMSFDQPEKASINLEDLEAWQISQREDYVEYEGVEAYNARSESPAPGF